MTTDHAAEARAFLDAWNAAGLPETIAATAAAAGDGETPGTYRRKLTKEMLRAVLDELKQMRDERERAVPYVDSKSAWDARQVGSFRACADCYSPITCSEADELRCP